jgi:flagellar hook-length control protein FliK
VSSVASISNGIEPVRSNSTSGPSAADAQPSPFAMLLDAQAAELPSALPPDRPARAAASPHTHDEPAPRGGHGNENPDDAMTRAAAPPHVAASPRAAASDGNCDENSPDDVPAVDGADDIDASVTAIVLMGCCAPPPTGPVDVAIVATSNATSTGNAEASVANAPPASTTAAFPPNVLFAAAMQTESDPDAPVPAPDAAAGAPSDLAPADASPAEVAAPARAPLAPPEFTGAAAPVPSAQAAEHTEQVMSAQLAPAQSASAEPNIVPAGPANDTPAPSAADSTKPNENLSPLGAQDFSAQIKSNGAESPDTTSVPPAPAPAATPSSVLQPAKKSPPQAALAATNGATAPQSENPPEAANVDTAEAAPLPPAAHGQTAKPTPTVTESDPELARAHHAVIEQPADAGVASASRAAAPANASTSAVELPPAAGAVAAYQVTTAQPQPGALPQFAAAAPAIAIADLPVAIATHAKNGSNRFEIRLDPPELGRIDVRLDIDAKGNVVSRLMAERPETLDLLRRDANQIERALQDAGLKTAGESLQFSLRQQSGRGDPVPPAPSAIAGDDDPVPLAQLQNYSRPLGLGAGIDIRV